jgi:hypothetical protein
MKYIAYNKKSSLFFWIVTTFQKTLFIMLKFSIILVFLMYYYLIINNKNNIKIMTLKKIVIFISFAFVYSFSYSYNNLDKRCMDNRTLIEDSTSNRFNAKEDNYSSKKTKIMYFVKPIGLYDEKESPYCTVNCKDNRDDKQLYRCSWKVDHWKNNITYDLAS